MALDGTSEALKEEKRLLEKKNKSPRKGSSHDVALRFVRANPADPFKEQLDLMTKTIQIGSAYNEPSIAGLD